MVGTMGNPNINALVFSIFAIIFIPFNYSKKQLSIFLLAILMVFLCQSRTALIAWALILIGITILRLATWKWKEWILILTGIVLMYFISWALATDFFKYSLYSNYILDGSILQTGSALGRWEAWTLLGNMIIEKPIFGHGVNKEFFYANHIYSENEYILMAWRYGIIGLILYIGLFLYPAFILLRNHRSTIAKIALLFLALLLTTALTNNPFSDRTVVIFFAIILGFSFETDHFLNNKSILPTNESN
jgi:O-antigen ligase